MIISFWKASKIKFHALAVFRTPIPIESIPIVTPFVFWYSNAIATFCDTCRNSISNLTVIPFNLLASFITSFRRIAFFSLSSNFISTNIFEFAWAKISKISAFPEIFYSTFKASVSSILISVFTLLIPSNKKIPTNRSAYCQNTFVAIFYHTWFWATIAT